MEDGHRRVRRRCYHHLVDLSFFDGHGLAKKTTMPTEDICDITPRDALRMAHSGNLPLLDIFARRLMNIIAHHHEWQCTTTIFAAFWESFMYLTDDESRLPSYFPESSRKSISEGYIYRCGYLYTRRKPAKRVGNDVNIIDQRMITIDALKEYLRGDGINDIVTYPEYLTQETADIIALAIRRGHRHRGTNMSGLISMTLSDNVHRIQGILDGIPDNDLWSIIRPRKRGRGDDISGIARISPRLFSMVRTDHLISLLRDDLSASASFFAVYEALHRGIDVYGIIMEYINSGRVPRYHAVMAYNNLCSFFGPTDSHTLIDLGTVAFLDAVVDWKVDAICHSQGHVQDYVDRVNLDDTAIWAITRAHPGITLDSQVTWRKTLRNRHLLMALVNRAMDEMVPDADILEAIDGKAIVDVCGGFMTNEVFRWYMRSLSPMYHVRIIGKIRMVKVFVDGWKTASVGFADVVILSA